MLFCNELLQRLEPMHGASPQWWILLSTITLDVLPHSSTPIDIHETSKGKDNLETLNEPPKLCLRIVSLKTRAPLIVLPADFFSEENTTNTSKDNCGYFFNEYQDDADDNEPNSLLLSFFLARPVNSNEEPKRNIIFLREPKAKVFKTQYEHNGVIWALRRYVRFTKPFWLALTAKIAI